MFVLYKWSIRGGKSINPDLLAIEFGVFDLGGVIDVYGLYPFVSFSFGYP